MPSCAAMSLTIFGDNKVCFMLSGLPRLRRKILMALKPVRRNVVGLISKTSGAAVRSFASRSSSSLTYKSSLSSRPASIIRLSSTSIALPAAGPASASSSLGSSSGCASACSVMYGAIHSGILPSDSAWKVCSGKHLKRKVYVNSTGHSSLSISLSVSIECWAYQPWNGLMGSLPCAPTMRLVSGKPHASGWHIMTSMLSIRM
mmetsp:Transcript_100655/g.307607  ORF Transcript_100655/g.307607 Transcript_100655/m.307607 type:complete len:203 (+) Transcript_100655:3517-4125(+)